MARMLGAGLSGQLYFFLNNIYFFLLAGSISLDAGITFFASKKAIPDQSLSSFALLWSVVISLLIAVPFFIFYSQTPELFQHISVFSAALCYVSGTFLYIFFNAFFYSHDDYKTPNLIAGIFNLLMLVLVPWKDNWLGFVDQQVFLLLFFLANLLQGIMIAVAWFQKKGIHISLRGFQSLSPVIRYSLAALAGNLTWFLLYRIDYWFVEYYCSEKSLGNYIQVSKLGQMLVLPAGMIAAILFPQASKENISFQSAQFAKLVKGIFGLYLLAALAVLALGKITISFLWGNEYDEMYLPLLIIMPGIICLAVSFLFSPIFSGKGKPVYNFYICLFTLLVVVISNFVFVPLWGIKGAALATSAGFFVMLSMYVWMAVSLFDFSFKKLFAKNGVS